MHRTRALFFALAFAATLTSQSNVASAPAGPPAPLDRDVEPLTKSPAAPSEAKLASHALAYAPSPVDNPLKGFVPFYMGSDYPKKFPHSMEWTYFALGDLMKDLDSFDWTQVEKALDDVAARGNQLAFRVYMEYPGRPPAIPEFLAKSGVALRKVSQWNTMSPDYDDPRTVRALSNFIKALGAKYDGDPRIAFVTTGLIGLWGEWHLWPSDQLFPKDAAVKQYIDAFDAAFDKTQIEIRFPDLAGGYPVKKNVGFHDDSFFWKENGKGATLPQSMGGWDWSFLEKALKSGGENRWASQSVGGEVRPEIQSSLFRGGPNVDDLKDCVEMTHVTWLINQKGVLRYDKGDPNVVELVREMGYELTVTEALFDDQISAADPLRVGVIIENRGVAPFYYPWQVVVAVADARANVVKTWSVPWDITKVQPKQIRAFPEWGLSGKPKYVPFGKPQRFEFKTSGNGLGIGKYTLLMRVVHPLEHRKPAQPPHPLRFANQRQTPNGWLELGELNVNH
jgi:hypothetical protein